MQSTSVIKLTLAQQDEERLIYRFVKRLTDLCVATVALVLFAPVLVVLAIAIKLDSPGPIFFTQWRTGVDRRRADQGNYSGPDRRQHNKFGQPFLLWKFRTMFHDSPERFPELYKFDFTQEEFDKLYVGQPIKGGGDPAEVDDPRLTRVGKWLRRTSLDEFPNFFNVIKGDISVVGPRPDIWQHIQYYRNKKHLEKFRIKPGITCIAQIKGRGRLTFEETNEYDLEYYRERSIISDFRVIAKTIKSVIKREGAY